MQTRRLGRTGHETSLAIFGAAALWQADEAQAAQALALALSRGVNQIDIAPSYGVAEDVLGPHLPAVRDQVFLSAKTARSNPDGVRAQMETTLRKLSTDRVDLYQAHGVTSLEGLEQRGAALDRVVALRDEGLTRFAGITGHGLDAPKAFLVALDRWDLDTVMFPVYPRLWSDQVYREAAERLLAVCDERDIGVMAIKAAAKRPWPDGKGVSPDSPDRHATTWYEPQTSRWAIERGVRFALSVPGVDAFCTPGDLGLLPFALDAAESYKPMAVKALEEAALGMQDVELVFPMPGS